MGRSSAKSIMVVDDESDILLVIEQMLLELKNITADLFSDPRKALEHFRANPTSTI